MNNTEENLKEINDKIAQYVAEFGRAESEVQLMAVSKKKSQAQIEKAYHAGQRIFGESYVQEAVEKMQQLQHLVDIEWHFIGPMQSNKTRDIARYFNWVHSVDRLKIAKRLNDQRDSELAPINICLQVNIDQEETKSGFLAREVLQVAGEIAQMPYLKMRGLMAIPKPEVEFEKQLKSNRAVLQLYQQLQQQHQGIDTLSLGMSNDMRAAIAAGSTMVRIGTAIFGARSN